MNQQKNKNVIIVGAGLAGLSCAVRLCQHGCRVVLLEATDRVGGRVRSDHIDGFILDHGFQVLQTAYPACRELLDYPLLNLQSFDSGALVRQNGRFETLADPWSNPTKMLETIRNPVGTFKDKLRIARLRHQSRAGTLQDLYARSADATTIERLRGDGFSDRFIDQFLRPFLGGIFLDESLQTRSTLLEFVFRMFSNGAVVVPAEGMEAIPRQLAAKLPEGTLRLQSTVAKLNASGVLLTDGQQVAAEHIVIATESDAAAMLIGKPELSSEWSGTTTAYYSSKQKVDSRKLLMLRGDETGLIQSACVISNVAPSYAPPDQHLISVSTLQGRAHDPESLDDSLRPQLSKWFGDQVAQWQLLQVYQVPFGLPKISMKAVFQEMEVRVDSIERSVFVCGDYRETPSIQGAMNSGLRVAAEILNR